MEDTRFMKWARRYGLDPYSRNGINEIARDAFNAGRQNGLEQAAAAVHDPCPECAAAIRDIKSSIEFV